MLKVKEDLDMREEIKPASDKQSSSATSPGLHEKIAKGSEEQEIERKEIMPGKDIQSAASMADGMHHWLSSEAIKLEEARKRGFTDQFKIEQKKLKSLSSNELFTPDQVKIIDHFRFEGTSDPDYMSILYLIETKTGRKGTVTDAFGTYGDTEIEDFMKQVKDCTVHNL